MAHQSFQLDREVRPRGTGEAPQPLRREADRIEPTPGGPQRVVGPFHLSKQSIGSASVRVHLAAEPQIGAANLLLGCASWHS